MNYSTARSYPSASPGPGHDPHNEEYPDGESGIQQEARTIGACVLFGLSEQIGKDTTTERTDLADHATGNRSGEGPSQRHELEGSSVARSERGETEHEEQSGGEEWRCSHQAEESGDGDEEDNRQGGDSSYTIGEPSTEDTGK